MTAEHELLLREADRLVDEAQAKATASVRAALGPSPIDLWPADTFVSPITGALIRRTSDARPLG